MPPLTPRRGGPTGSARGLSQAGCTVMSVRWADASPFGLRTEGMEVAITEGMRYQLHQGLEQALGPENAATMMSYLPPVGWADVATKRDLEYVTEVLSARIDSLEHRLRAEFQAGLRSNLLGMIAANAATAGLIVAALKLG